MPCLGSPVPAIHISFAPPEPERKDEPEPSSPFFLNPASDEDGYRSTLLSPPPTVSPKPLSPLRPKDVPVNGQGLDRDRFEALLRQAREKSASVGAKRSPDLRKEIALRAHKSKQMERRAIFLSKLQAPPSPSAANLPKTPPESPAVFHYSLPSPGLVSPLALFESLHTDDPAAIHTREHWVEQVNFRLPQEKKFQPQRSPVSPGPGKPLPSLDQITARLSENGHVRVRGVPEAQKTTRQRSPIPLPAFLNSNNGGQENERVVGPISPVPTISISAPSPPLPVVKSKRAAPKGVGRLQFPARPANEKPYENTLPSSPTPPSPLTPTICVHPPETAAMAPKSPGAPVSPKLQIHTTVVPRTNRMSPTELNEGNLQALNLRARTASDMLSTLRRRTVNPSARGMSGYDREEEERREKVIRRHSAPAELQQIERMGFRHPVLEVPGGF